VTARVEGASTVMVNIRSSAGETLSGVASSLMETSPFERSLVKAAREGRARRNRQQAVGSKPQTACEKKVRGRRPEI